MSRISWRLAQSDVWNRVLSVVAVLLCFGAAAIVSPRVPARYAMLLAGGLGGLVLLGQPQLGLVLLIPAGLLVPFALGTGTQTEVPITLFMLAAMLGIWVWTMYRERDFRLAVSPANGPLIALVVVAGLSIVAGQALWNPMVATKSNFLFVQLAQWAVFVLSAGAFWLTANLVRETRWLKWIVGVFLTLAAVYIGLHLLPGGQSVLYAVFVNSATGSLFRVWLVAMALGQALFNRRLRRPIRLALLALAGVSFYVAWSFTQDWVAGWAPPLVALVVIAWLRSPMLGGLLAGGMALGVQLFGSQLVRSIIVPAVQTGSFLRLDAWQGILQLVGKRWPLGLGLAAYWHYWQSLIGTWAFSSSNVTYNPEVNSHNNYIDIYAQMGVIGLAVFLWLVVALWRQGWRIRKAVSDGFELGYVYGCLGGLAGSLAAGLLADWLLPFVYNIGLAGTRASILAWLFLGGLVSLNRGNGREVQDVDP